MTSPNILESHIVFKAHEDFNSNYFRIPFLATTPKGTLIAGSDIRYTDSSDYNQIDIGIARSEDGGKTWQDKQIVHKNNGLHQHSRKMDGAILVDQETGRIFLFALAIDMHDHLNAPDHKMKDFVYKYSDDDGKTWSSEISLMHFLDEGCILFFQGPGNGIQLQNGTLVLPIQRWVPNTELIRAKAGIIYSSDHGQTWHRSHALIDTYTSESAVVEYRPNEILISSRAPLTHGRCFYTTSNLGDTWQVHEADNTLFELGGCQSSMLKFTAPNQKTYALHTAPQQDDSFWHRNKLTLMASDDYTTWNYISEVIHLNNDGYTCLSYDQANHKLYMLGEQNGSLVLYNLTCYLPLIMQNTRSYSHQARSTIHKHPVYSQGHYIRMSHPNCWYKLLQVKLKKDGFLLLNLNLLGFNLNEMVTLRLKQTLDTAHDLAHCTLSHSSMQTGAMPLELTLIPTRQEDETFIYELYLKCTSEEVLSMSVQNCLMADYGKTNLLLHTSFQDPAAEKYKENLPASYLELPLLKNNIF